MSVRALLKVAQRHLGLVSVASAVTPYGRGCLGLRADPAASRKGCLWLGLCSTHAGKPVATSI